MKRSNSLRSTTLTHLILLVGFTTSGGGGWFGNDCMGRVAAADSVQWKIGIEFRKALEAPLGLNWGDNPAREALRNLSNNQRVAIWPDRRIDPSKKLQFESQDLPLDITLDKLCEKYKLGRSVVGPVVYLGPPSTTEKLATLAAVKRQQVGQQSAQERAKWARSAELNVPALGQPRELVRELAQQAGATLENPEAIPHDLWPAMQLPPLSLADRLTLILAGFDLTFETSADGSTIRIVPAPDKIEYEQKYSWRGANASLASQLAKKFPELKIRKEGEQVFVTGKYEIHELIDRMLSGESVRTAKVVPGDKRYSLRVENQLAGAIVKRMAQELGKTMEYDPSLTEKLQTKVSFNVKDVTMEELLATALKPVGLVAEIKEAALVITTKPEQ
ncbi:STN domain-containing protein [Anatilimnocola sp. NA78]|uniref:STN domain-containing protein n=1 Tax=Anatilimnocola sp. NA78 TaxID=3415683 RepID=UPI003CE5B175